MTIYYEIDELFEDATVELEITCSVQNDSFSHAFGTETYPDYLQIENVSYRERDYTTDQKKEIKRWIEENETTLNEFVSNYNPGYDGEPDFDDEPDHDFDYAYHQYDKHYNY